MRGRHGVLSVWGLVVLWVGAVPCVAKDGVLRLRVKPNQAYVFIDGSAQDEGSGSFRLSPGEHKLSLHNYGYLSVTQTFTIAPGKATKLDIALQPAGGVVSGPWGRIQIEGPPRSVVLLNGKTPDFFVGHVDEFDHDIIWKQELLVPPGTHQITVLNHGDNKELYSNSVAVKANERVIIKLRQNGEQVRKPWARGESLKSVPRFKAGIASTTVAVGPASAEFSAAPAKINCGESAQLAWKTSGVASAQISGIGSVPAEGQQTVQPKETTTYKFTASGIGGVLDSSATVTVNNDVVGSLNLDPPEVRYRRVGDKVEEQGSATLTWATSNAQSVSLDPMGSVSASSANQTVQAAPKKTTPGPVDETVTYTLTASNACGGSLTRTAALHITGSIAPVIQAKSPTESALEISLAMNSIYFPTALPAPRDPNGGLVSSQQRLLTGIASNYKKYLQYRPDAHLTLQAHADSRGSVEYNKALSERRSARVKSFLVGQGIPEANLETVAFGKERNLQEEAVKRLTEENPNITAEEKQKILKDMKAHVLANNRRVDLVLSTTGQQSTKYFPASASDVQEILGEKPAAKPPAAKKPATRRSAPKKQ